MISGGEAVGQASGRGDAEGEGRHPAALCRMPTGGAPDHFGEVKNFLLPHARLSVSYSTKRFQFGSGSDTTLAPDQLIEKSYADWLAGRDRALERIVSLLR